MYIEELNLKEIRDTLIELTKKSKEERAYLGHEYQSKISE